MVDSTPEGIRSEQAAAFAAVQLEGRPRVLHVGRSSSLVPSRLGEVGFDVTAINCHQLADLEAGFDAIVFTHALSVSPSLETCIEHAARLVAPNGRIVVDDLDSQAIDTSSLRWYYDVVELLAVAGRYAPERVHRPQADILARWRDGTRSDGVVTTGTEMRVAISTRFAIRDLRRVEGFYRHLGDGLADDARGAAIATHVRAVERRLIASDSLLPVGLRIVADRAR